MTLALPSPKEFTLAVRRPVWAGDAFVVKVNGAAIEQPTLASLRDLNAGGRGGAPGMEATQASSYVELKRTWKSGDTIELDDAEIAAPRTDAGQSHGRGDHVGTAGAGGRPWTTPRRAPRPIRRPRPIPALVAADRPLESWVVPAGTRQGDFKAQNVARVFGQAGRRG